ncbi:MAG: hypothetical protein K6F29_00790 [Bacteroidales bacterium]|nr:hypothetical protein [Bacteroidales bacterium]
MDELTTRRLAVIKQLYLHGLNQSYEVEPMNGFSILSFHDSVEMFMKLCAEQRNIKINRDVNFGDYFTKLPELQCSATMTSLNSKRINLKHYGTLPSKLDIEISRANVTDFFDLNTPVFFGVQFSDISLISLIKYKSVREYMEKALSDFSANNFKESISNSQIAFKELLWSYEKENTIDFESIFGKSCDFSFLSSFHLQLGLGRNLDNFVDNVAKSIPLLEERLNIIGLGIDYIHFRKFKLLSPYIQMWPSNNGNNRYQVFVDEERDKRICSQKNAQFCLDFVIDSALKLQRFDVNIDGTIKTDLQNN